VQAQTLSTLVPISQCAAYGNFSGPKAQEIVVSRGKVLELLRPNELGKMVTVYSIDVFGCIRSIVPFRITGAPTDYLIVGSDSGRIVVLAWDKDRNAFKKVWPSSWVAWQFRSISMLGFKSTTS
jgi:splicing factor 3B subunit 3